jgi:hypothetical protein
MIHHPAYTGPVLPDRYQPLIDWLTRHDHDGREGR